MTPLGKNHLQPKIKGCGCFLIVLAIFIIASQNLTHAQQPPKGTSRQASSSKTQSTNPESAGEAKAPLPNPANIEAMEKMLLPNAQVAGKPILIDKNTESLDQRLSRMITLDVREMNIIDVLKFLSLKGDFNMVTSGNVQGRVTLYLKNVSIKDALDIILISNNLAYYLQNEILNILGGTEYEAMFGKRFNNKQQVAIVNLKYAKPGYVVSALESIKSALGKIIIDEDTGSVVMIDTPESLAQMRKSLEEMEKPIDVVVYSLQYAKADVVAEKLKARLDALTVGSITMDERSNQVIIRALPGRSQEVEAMLKGLDVPTKEVLIDINVLQIVLKPKFDMGIDWSLDFSSLNDPWLKNLTFKNTFLNEGSLSSSDNLSSTFTKIGVGSITVNHFASSVRMLQQVSDTKILSNPKILVTNNEEATIHIGDTVPYIISTTSGTGDNAITSEDVRFVDVGLKLNVKPTINDDGFVTMRLKPEISTVVSSLTSKGGGIPQVNKTFVETTVMIQDGTTIILGGLKKDNKVHTKKGLPGLMDIPIVGRIFSRATDSIEKTEIVLFITPHIITGDKNLYDINGTIQPSKDYREAVKDGPGFEDSNSGSTLQLKE